MSKKIIPSLNTKFPFIPYTQCESSDCEIFICLWRDWKCGMLDTSSQRRNEEIAKGCEKIVCPEHFEVISKEVKDGGMAQFFCSECYEKVVEADYETRI